MRKTATINKEEESMIDLTPMLDVVFIMLIFFIVTSSFIKESGIEVLKPETTEGIKKPRTSLLIAINGKNEIWVDRRSIDRPLVKPVVSQLFAENPKGAVVIQADQESNSETVLFVMEVVRDIGVSDIAIATTEK
jgi:biopolymer transport protein ExbD